MTGKGSAQGTLFFIETCYGVPAAMPQILRPFLAQMADLAEFASPSWSHYVAVAAAKPARAAVLERCRPRQPSVGFSLTADAPLRCGELAVPAHEETSTCPFAHMGKRCSSIRRLPARRAKVLLSQRWQVLCAIGRREDKERHHDPSTRQTGMRCWSRPIRICGGCF